uniref:Uroporphyrinogen decarboxylase n=1 Tax=Helicotheca tamesis TaxID=374047 RepID=A0A7S2IGI8_9STRA|mmetsp:Transcript_9111/g.12651  ORF Transcript_9111/g.12651 Transcript_9111/m.12651 type:complete len:469 (+) Transcript_9111:172-1578(+)|eukprot:CAMPEP_0185731520 /NCGR_PEP_ID=MMETSP1171-20130828/13144_1 /TAXON_ID=374046 /ORGANISM="Helicotheca tamensis, Strain CCMP826" /LENGTH=468 /DNA_ID=CAMNT_0028400801 /DNA_START=89 /DNA_END=1495 /DNA_ORIENTATION=-
MMFKATASILLLLLSSSTNNAFSFITPSTATRRSFLSSISSTTILSLTTGPDGVPAKNAEEDLELTRQIILAHIAKENSDSSSEPKEEEEESGELGYPENDLMIRAALGREDVERTPVWLFRQAGRHLPEYQEYKQVKGRSFLDMLSHPEDVAECTMQPLRRYPVDAAILFSDILVIAEALNVEVTMPGGVGILVPNPLSDPDDMAKRIPPPEEMTPQFVQEKLGHVMTSVKLIRSQMAAEGKSIPLIGFSAAPWTLLFYMVGGSSRKNKEAGTNWLKEYPEASQKLLDTLTKIVVEYMAAQVEAGAHMLQLFEAMGMMIDEEKFYEFAMPCLKVIAEELKGRYPDVPLMVFSRGACFANEELSKLGFDVVTIDGSVDRSTARGAVSGRAGLQGNYDPRELIPDEEGTKTPETVRQTAKEMLEALGPQRLIANLGEGLGGKESPELVSAFVDAIHEESEAMIKAAVAS